MVKKELVQQSISGSISTKSSIAGNATKGAGVTDHNRLYNRDVEDQHPIDAITGLREELNAKLDSETALPLIEEAVNGKAAGLYYDAKKELARKAYWYLCAEIDHITKMGTKDSIISGPYDLGQGGGGGGGVTNIIIKQINWPAAVVVGAEVILTINWTSTIGDDREPTGPGTIYVSVNGKQVIVLPNQAQGLVNLDVSKYIVAGNNQVQVTVLDAYGTTGTKVGTINAVTFELKSNFDPYQAYTDKITYTYIPYGNIEKTVYFKVDGAVKGTQRVTASGEQQSYVIKNLTHGHHKLEVYFTASISGATVTSNVLVYDLIYYEVGNTTPIIASTFDLEQVEQYIPFNIPYLVYIYGRNNFDVSLYRDSTLVQTLNVDTQLQYWEVKESNVGTYTYKIQCGETVRYFPVQIVPSTIDVQPVSSDLALALYASGRSNTEPLPERAMWRDVEHNISCDLTNFNWRSNGWVKDAENITVLRLSGDARVRIPYKPFLNESKVTGKTIELEIATSAVMNYSSTIISCLDGQSTDFFEGKGSFVDEDSRQFIFDVSVNPEIAITKFVNTGSYVLNYTANGWIYNGEVINLAEYGITLTPRRISTEGEEDLVLVGDNIIIDYSIQARGFYVTPQVAVFKSQQSSLSTQYKEDDHVHLAFTIEKSNENRIIWMYINGIASGAYLYPSSDSFRQLSPSEITLGSNEAVLDIYCIRIYDNDLSSKQIVNNWIANTADAALKAERYYRNDNYDDANNIIISKLPSGTPYIIWDVNPMPQYKGDKQKGNGRYVDPTNSARNFTTENVEYNVQGTSSAVYPVKNIRMRPKKSDAWYDDNGDPIKKWPITYPDGIGVDYYTFKVDYASSEGANNVELVRLYDNICKAYRSDGKAVLLTPPQRQNSKVRVGIDGFPVVAFHQDLDGNIAFCTKANFNNDKSNPDVYGLKDAWDGETYLGDESWETTNNSADEAKYKIPVTPENWKKAFESRWPDDKTPDEHVYGTNPGDLDKLSAMTSWVASTYRVNATNNPIPEVTFTYSDVIAAEDGTYSTRTVTKTFDHDTAEYRLTKFKAELENWFDVNSTIFYYLFTHLFLMVDSRAKNAFPTYYTSRALDDGGNRWFWLPYDMDTAIGINNEGKLAFDYNLEDTDTVNGADVFNGQDSVLWCNLRDMFAGEIGKMYSELRTQRLISYDIVEQMFEEHQGKWSENIFNEDSKIKYVDPLENGDNYLEMLQGAKAEQRKWWLYNRFKYFDSKYTAGDAKADMILFRAYVPAGTVKPDIIITPYADIYATVTYTNGEAGTISRRAKRNEPIIIPNPLDPSTAMTDQEVHIFSASQLKSIGDISGFRPDTVKVGNAIKLQDLKVGDGSIGYENPNLKELTLGSNTLLKTLDVRNCPNLTQTVDLRGCINLEEIYFENTGIQGIELPDGGNIKKLHLPASLRALTIRNHPLLNDLQIAGTENIESLWLENIPPSVISIYDAVHDMRDNAAVRLIGIDEHYSTKAEIEALYDELDRLEGLDSTGAPVAKAQVTGTISLPTISYTDYEILTARYPEVRISAGQMICRVDFQTYNHTLEIYEPYGAPQTVVAGEDATRPADPPDDETVSSVWKFVGWDKPLINIQANTIIKATYHEEIRQYTVRFHKNAPSPVTVNPETEIINYNDFATEPVVSGYDPEKVQFIGWYTIDGNHWNFATHITANVDLYAHWQDEDAPTLDPLLKLNYKTFKATGFDNLGIVAWAVIKDPVDPAVEPASWTPIEPTLSFEQDYTINASGTYYFWIKDSAGKTASTSTVANHIETIIDPGVSFLAIKEGDAVLTDFALANTDVIIEVVVDEEHYEDFRLTINGVPLTYPYNWRISEDIILRANCTPKQYTVTFSVDLPMSGSVTPQPITPATETLTYLSLVPTPAKQFVIVTNPESSMGFVISHWVDDFGNTWNFAVDRVQHDINLSAVWQPYSAPTTVTVVIPAGAEAANRVVAVNFNQARANTLTVNWGDGTGDFDSGSNCGSYTNINHTYAYSDEEQVFEINIYINNKLDFIFGSSLAAGYNGAMITPSSYVTNVSFAYNVLETNLGQNVLAETSISQICLTEYMAKVPIGCFKNCPNIIDFSGLPATVRSFEAEAFSGANLTGTITIPSFITSVGDSVFKDCTHISGVNFGSLTTISSSMFEGCIGLESLTIPTTISTIGPRAFANCVNLEKLVLENPNLTISGNIGQVLFMCENLTTAGPIGGEYDIEFAWDRTIPKYAFHYSKLDTIVLPNTITNIDDYAFAEIGDGHSTLTVVLSTALERIGNNAFSNSANLRTLQLPANLRTIGAHAFASTRLTLIDIPSTTTYIGRGFCQATPLAVATIRVASLEDITVNADLDEAWFNGASTGLKIYIPQEAFNDPAASYGTYWNYRAAGQTFNYYVIDD